MNQIQFQFAEETKEYAQKQLYATDWVTCSDVNLVNLDDFINYRRIIRYVCLNPTANYIFPKCPDPVWAE